MSDPYLGEIRAFGFNFAPRGWVLCNGATLQVGQYTALFSILGATYGGNGQTTFAVPNLCGRTPISQGQGPGLSPRALGQNDGVETVSLTPNQLPSHTHQLNAAQLATPAGAQNITTPQPDAFYGISGPGQAYTSAAANTQFDPRAIAPVGGGLPHENRQPFLVMNYCIAVQGVFPQRP